MWEQAGLNVRKLLEKTYFTLGDRHESQEIILPPETLAEIAAEIAKDSDCHRTRVDYMHYKRARLFKLVGKSWAIARGECVSYPAGPYDSDLLALEFLAEGKTPEQVQEELKAEIEQSTCFRNSLFYGLAAGNLALPKDGRFFKEMEKRLLPEYQRFVAQRPEYDKSVIRTSTLQHPTIKSVFYKHEFADFLADTIEEVLERS